MVVVFIMGGGGFEVCGICLLFIMVVIHVIGYGLLHERKYLMQTWNFLNRRGDHVQGDNGWHFGYFGSLHRVDEPERRSLASKAVKGSRKTTQNSGTLQASE